MASKSDCESVCLNHHEYFPLRWVIDSDYVSFVSLNMSPNGSNLLHNQHRCGVMGVFHVCEGVCVCVCVFGMCSATEAEVINSADTFVLALSGGEVSHGVPPPLHIVCFA